MNRFVVVRLLDPLGVYSTRTRVIGTVEIRNARSDLPSERSALQASRSVFGEKAPEPDLTMRMATVVESLTSFEAQRVAEQRFEEVLDALVHESPLSRMALINAGCITNLRTGKTEPRIPTPESNRAINTFHWNRDYFPQMDFVQFLFTGERTDLNQRLVRSYHWSRMASSNSNRQLRVLFRWFAMETVWTLSRDDDITPRILWSLGFANGARARRLSPAFRLKLTRGDPAYRHWHAETRRRLRAIKALRNDSVHNGFRQRDLPTSDLDEYDHLTFLACPRVQRMASHGLTSGLTTAKELFDELPRVFESMPHAIDDVHGTVIFSLSNPGLLRRRWHA